MSTAAAAAAKLLAPASLSLRLRLRLRPSALVPTPRLLSVSARYPLRVALRSSPPALRRVAAAAASSASAPAAARTISVGDRLPDATLSYFGADGELQTVRVGELTKGKKAVLFAVPGAFTPTCSQKHLPGFVEKAGEIRARGVDVIACISVNDAFVMRAWKESLSVPDDQVLLLSDGNGDFTRALGVELDLTDKPVGLGVRSRRYAMLVDDGVVKVLNLEEGGAFTTSSADEILKAL